MGSMQIEVGAILDGKVTGLTNFGAFVSLEGGATGMVHISEVSNTYVKDIREYLSDGQQVKVKVLTISPEGKISLSIKQAAAPVSEQQPQPSFASRPKRNQSRPNVWQGQPQQSSNEPASFEDMMAKFKQVSDEKMTDLKRSKESKHGGFSRGARKGQNG